MVHRAENFIQKYLTYIFFCDNLAENAAEDSRCRKA